MQIRQHILSYRPQGLNPVLRWIEGVSQPRIDDQGMVRVVDLRQLLLEQPGFLDRNLSVVLSLQDQDAGRNIADDLGGIVQGEVGLKPWTCLHRLIGEQMLDLHDDQRLQLTLDADIAPRVGGYDRVHLVLAGRIVLLHEACRLQRCKILRQALP